MASNIVSVARNKIVATFQSTGNTLIPNNTPTTFVWDTVVKDDESAMDVNTGVYTAAETGYYTVSMIVYGQAVANITYLTEIKINTVTYVANFEAGNSGSTAGFFITATIPLEKDDELEFVLTQSGAGYTPNVGVEYNFLSIVQVS